MAELIRAGQTEVTLDADALQPATGLTVSSVSDISASESSDFDFGLDITEDSNFVFDEVDDFASANGTIEHTGTITYTGSIGDVTVGDFSVGFDESRVSDTTSGFFVANNIEEVLPEGQILFDVGIPDGVNVGGNRINIGAADLLVAEEFAETLQTQGTYNR